MFGSYLIFVRFEMLMIQDLQSQQSLSGSEIKRQAQNGRVGNPSVIRGGHIEAGFPSELSSCPRKDVRK
jgi:hypothetical protein